MRLIDADKLIEPGYTDMFDEPIRFDMVSRYAIETAPTVKAIPLDKPFCKMVYGDYVCYNRNWLMKHLPMELDILQGKAIPVEWIKKYIKQNYCTCDLVYPEEFLKELVTWWGEENETN